MFNIRFIEAVEEAKKPVEEEQVSPEEIMDRMVRKSLDLTGDNNL